MGTAAAPQQSYEDWLADNPDLTDDEADEWFTPSGRLRSEATVRRMRDRRQSAKAKADHARSSSSSTSRPSTGSATTRRSSTQNGSDSMLKFSTDDGAGFALGLIAFALGSSWFRYGWPGVTGWLSAKFLNRVTIGTAPSSSSSGGRVNGTHTSPPLPPAQKPDPTPVGAGPPPTITSPARPGNHP